MKSGFLESEKIIIRSLELKKIGSLESENRVPAGPYRVPNILKILIKKYPDYNYSWTFEGSQRYFLG